METLCVVIFKIFLFRTIFYCINANYAKLIAAVIFKMEYNKS